MSIICWLRKLSSPGPALIIYDWAEFTRETRCAMRVTVLVPGKWIRATDDDGSDLTPEITSPSFGLNANSTKQQVIDAWAQHNWKLIGQCDSASASLFVVDR